MFIPAGYETFEQAIAEIAQDIVRLALVAYPASAEGKNGSQEVASSVNPDLVFDQCWNLIGRQLAAAQIKSIGIIVRGTLVEHNDWVHGRMVDSGNWIDLDGRFWSQPGVYEQLGQDRRKHRAVPDFFVRWSVRCSLS